MPLVNLGDLTVNATSTATFAALKSFIAEPVILYIFAPILVIGGLYLIVALIKWISTKLSIMFHPMPTWKPNNTGSWRRGRGKWIFSEPE